MCGFTAGQTLTRDADDLAGDFAGHEVSEYSISFPILTRRFANLGQSPLTTRSTSGCCRTNHE